MTVFKVGECFNFWICMSYTFITYYYQSITKRYELIYKSFGNLHRLFKTLKTPQNLYNPTSRIIAMRLYILLIILVLLTSAAYAQECVRIIGGERINSSTLLCKGTYLIDTTIEITSDNIFLDCDMAQLKGTSPISAIIVEGKSGVRIRNCNISGFNNAIYLSNANENSITGNIITDNNNGIVLQNSPDNLIEQNTFQNNIRDIFNFTVELPEQEPQPEQIISQTQLQIQQEHESNQLFNDLKQRFEKYINTSKENILINRTFEYDEASNTTTVKIIISVSKEAVNFTYYEKIPKCFAIYTKEVVFKDTGFRVIHDDIIVRWDVSQISKEKIIEYAINKKIFKDCEELFEGFGFGEIYEETKKKNYAKNTFLIILSIIIIASVMFYKNKKIAKNKYVKRYKP